MRIPRHVVVLFALGSLILAGGAACDVRQNYVEDGVVRPEPVTEIQISGGGDVTVLPDEAIEGIDIRRMVRYTQTAPGDTVRFDGATAHVSTDCGNRCDISYEIRLPRGVKVTGQNDSGNLILRSVSDVDVRVSSGDIEVDDATGAVTAHADSGNIRLARITGDVRATTSSGDIDGRDLRGARTVVEASSGTITLDLPGTGDVTAQASSGDIDVQVPDRSCRVTVRSGSGDENIDVASDPQSPHVLDVSTDSGNITVAPSGSQTR